MRAAVLVALAACSGTAPPPVTAAPPPTAEAPGWQARGPGGRDPIDLGTTDPALVDAAGCAGCHAAIAAEWADSRHGRAWTNGIFQREYTAQPRRWCLNCHAPTPPQQAGLAAGDPRLADQGVACAACHVRGGRIIAARALPGSPHAPRVDPGFGSPAFCADCHQFTFPVLDGAGAVIRMTAHPMQDTVGSFRRGPYAGESGGCMVCHDSAHGHAFPGGHDPELLDTALAVDWCRRGGAIEVSLDNVAGGHTLPTGDVHRHLNVRVWRSSAPEAMFEAFLGRRFEPAPDGGKRTTWDSSIGPGEARRYTVDLAALGAEDDPGEPVNLALDYVFVADEFPRPGRGPGEPPATAVLRRRAAPAAIAPCPAR